MAANLLYNNLEVEPIGVNVTIPGNDIARLMYYLSCVATVIDHDKADILIDYEHYYLLSEAEKDLLIELASLFNPLIFLDAGIFIRDDSLIPPDADNEFYQITDHRIGIHVNEEVMIGGHSVKVLKVMACNDTWLTKFYINPLNNFKRTLNVNDKNSVDSSHSYTRKRPDDECCCSIF